MCQAKQEAADKRVQSLYPRAGLFNLGTVDILGWIVLRGGRCPVSRRTFSNILGPYPLDASSISPSFRYDNQNCLQTLPDVPWGMKLLLVAYHCSYMREVWRTQDR